MGAAVIGAHDDRGAAEALGLVLIFPVMVGLVLLVQFLGRQVDTRSQIQAAADAAAQSAALERDVDRALDVASRAARLLLTDEDACAAGPAVTIDAGAWHAGGTITVIVACTPRRDDLALLAPPPRTLRASSMALIDPNRAPGLP
jgi:Flp pilus assembly protein TadG